MADGVTLPLTGDGDATAEVATDDAGAAGHVQIIKLAISSDGSATVIPADATNGLDVDVTRVSGNVTVVDGGSTLSVDDGAGSLTVDDGAGSITVDNNGTFATQATISTAIPAGNNNIGDVDVASDASLYTEGDTDASITGRPILWEDAANTLATVTSSKPLPVSIVPLASGTDSIESMAGVRTTGGASIQAGLSAASTNAANVKSSAGQVYGWYLYNQAAYAVWLKFYNTAGTPTAGSGTPVLRIGIPAAGGANIWFASGIAFATGIGITITKLIADNDTTAVALNDLAYNILYK